MQQRKPFYLPVCAWLLQRNPWQRVPLGLAVVGQMGAVGGLAGVGQMQEALEGLAVVGQMRGVVEGPVGACGRAQVLRHLGWKGQLLGQAG